MSGAQPSAWPFYYCFLPDLLFVPPAKESKWCSGKSPELGTRGPEFQSWPWHFVAFGTLGRWLRLLWVHRMWRTISAGEQCWGGEEQAHCNLAVASSERQDQGRRVRGAHKRRKKLWFPTDVLEEAALMVCAKAFVILSQDTVFFSSW